jgi:hypothetical protein
MTKDERERAYHIRCPLLVHTHNTHNVSYITAAGKTIELNNALVVRSDPAGHPWAHHCFASMDQ